MAGTIVVVGSINMDLVVRAPRHPAPGETILGSDFHTIPGGKGANQAVAAARLGGQVKMIGRVGDDAFGGVLLDNLRKDGVDTRYVPRTAGVASGVALITVSDAGQNNIVVVPGSNWRLTPEDVRAAEAAFEGAAAVLMQQEIPPETVAEAVSVARKHGVRTILNPSPSRALSPDFLKQVDCLIPNEYELAQLAGVEGITTAANELKSIGLDCLIVTLGSDGALVLDGDQTYHIESYPVDVVDTTAAGDAFAGGFAVGLAEGKSTVEAATWGNAAGALAVTKMGAQPSLPTRAALQAFLEKNPAKIA